MSNGAYERRPWPPTPIPKPMRMLPVPAPLTSPPVRSRACWGVRRACWGVRRAYWGVRRHIEAGAERCLREARSDPGHPRRSGHRRQCHQRRSPRPPVHSRARDGSEFLMHREHLLGAERSQRKPQRKPQRKYQLSRFRQSPSNKDGHRCHNGHTSALACVPSAVLFTFARDPIETPVAEWLEVMCRTGKYSAARSARARRSAGRDACQTRARRARLRAVPPRCGDASVSGARRGARLAAGALTPTPRLEHAAQ